MTEKQKYRVVKTFGEVEIRTYEPYVSADIQVDSSYEKAPNIGFRPLANYIFSNNISMTAPVIIQETNQNNWQVSFVMPEGSKISDMPTPQENVKLNAQGEETCAAIKFKGLTSMKRIKSFEKKLSEILQGQGIAIVGPFRIARFDPPWKPGFLRHNEIVVPVSIKN